jgi:hypothetical protein
MLLNRTTEEIEKLINDMADEVNKIDKNCLMLSWWMRGGCSLTDIFNMSHKQREMINEIIDQNIETTKKTGMAFF